jgi:hypothetical protein
MATRTTELSIVADYAKELFARKTSRSFGEINTDLLVLPINACAALVTAVIVAALASAAWLTPAMIDRR